MLGKLIKYEFKSTAKWFLIMYAALIIITVFNKLTITLNTNNNSLLELATVLLTLTYVLTILSSYVITLVLVIARFYKTMVTDEGYLTHTLPVKTISHVNSKLIVSAVWFILSVIVMIASIMILGAGDGLIAFFNAIGDLFSSAAKDGFLGDLIITVLLIIFLLLASLLYYILPFYCAIALGSLFTKHKLAGAVGMYFVIYFVMQIFGLIFSIFLFSFDMDNAIANFVLGGAGEIVYGLTEGFSGINFMLISFGLYSLLFAAIFYIITNVVLSKKLNLD